MNIPEIGKWYIDGFCTNQIITPVNDDKYQNGIRWDVVKRCVSREIAEIRIKHHNKDNMIKETYYTRDYERWITPIERKGETFCLAFGKTAIESKQRAKIIDNALSDLTDNGIHSNHGDRHSGWSV